MSKGTYKDLRDLRERLANLRPATVAELAGIPLGRLLAVENGAAPSVFEIEHLATVYGIDPDPLRDDPIHIEDEIGVLTSQDELPEVSDLAGARILRAAGAVRDLVTLRGLLADVAEPLEPQTALRTLLADPTLEDDDFPLPEVPVERRGTVAQAAVRAWARGLIPRDACARCLGVTPGSGIERIADDFVEALPPEPALTG